MEKSMRRRVPWLNREEFEAAFKGIYSDDVIQMKHALNMLMTWKVRQPDHLPVSIQLTSDLLAIRIKDIEENEEEYNDVVCFAYGLAIVRFVNLLLEPFQKMECAQPVHILAKKIGIPSWIVDLRHEGTHRKLPSLELLRISVDFALNYLKDNYWIVNMMPENQMKEPQCNCPSVLAFKQNIMQSLSEFISSVLEENETFTASALRDVLIAMEIEANAECEVHGTSKRMLKDSIREALIQWMSSLFSKPTSATSSEIQWNSRLRKEISTLLGVTGVREGSSGDVGRWMTVERDEDEDWTNCAVGLYPGQKIQSLVLTEKHETLSGTPKQKQPQSIIVHDDSRLSSVVTGEPACFVDADMDETEDEWSSIPNEPVQRFESLTAKTVLCFY